MHFEECVLVAGEKTRTQPVFFADCVLVTREKTRTQPVHFEECVLVTKETSGSHPANTHITRTFFLASCNPDLFEIEYYIENTGIMSGELIWQETDTLFQAF